jgi:hypothetical protein
MQQHQAPTQPLERPEPALELQEQVIPTLPVVKVVNLEPMVQPKMTPELWVMLVVEVVLVVLEAAVEVEVEEEMKVAVQNQKKTLENPKNQQNPKVIRLHRWFRGLRNS